LLKKSALTRVLHGWVLLEVVSIDWAGLGFGMGWILETGHGTRPIRRDHAVLFITEGMKLIELAGAKRKHAFVQESMLVSILDEEELLPDPEDGDGLKSAA
jgi:hypothetical protein